MRLYKEASSGAAGVLHKLTKQKPPPPEQVPSVNGTVSSPLWAREAQRQDWGRIWLIDDPVQAETRPWLEDATAEDVALP